MKKYDDRQVILQERKALGIKDGRPVLGIALSGGGIRSASFGLGVLQSLLEHGVLQKADYLSTVSGGGYTGSALTWFRRWHAGKGEDYFDDTHPLGEKGPAKPSDETFVSFLRQHGEYIMPGNGLNLMSAIAILLKSFFVSALIYFSLLVVCIGIAGIFARLSFVNTLYNFAGKVVPLPFQYSDVSHQPFYQLFVVLSIISMVVFAAAAIFFTLYAAIPKWICPKSDRHYYKYRRCEQRLLGRSLTALISCVILLSVPVVYGYIKSQIILLGVFGYGSGVWAGITRMRKFMGLVAFFKNPWANDQLFRWCAFFFIYTGLIAAYHFSVKIGIPLSYSAAVSEQAIIGLEFILLIALVAGGYLNINNSTVGSMYRDRLMETFLPRAKAIEENKWLPAGYSASALMEEMCRDDNGKILKPYHLINTNIILTRSRQKRFKNRGGDSFLISPLYCGSVATDYVETSSYFKRGKSSGGITLATAMATSGAAVNPHTAVAGAGPTRDWLVSIIMTFFNLRLGFWATNPAMGGRRHKPNYIRPGLCSLTGVFGHDEKDIFIELTDGGHFENLGIYELVRRRVDSIIVSDGAEDKDFTFGDLANAVERVRSDFGVIIRFKPEDLKLGAMLPNSLPSGRFAEKFKLAQRAYAVGTIRYPAQKPFGPAKEGKIYYLKLTLPPNLPADVYGYKARHADFPSQSTADQFFDENQFEAYRELGYRAAEPVAEQLA